jgi:hypothetical protein
MGIQNDLLCQLTIRLFWKHGNPLGGLYLLEHGINLGAYGFEIDVPPLDGTEPERTRQTVCMIGLPCIYAVELGTPRKLFSRY